jgi:hypothetical protein
MRIAPVILLAALLVACNTPQQSPTAVSDARLVDGNLPKVIITIDMTQVAATTQPTATPDNVITPTPTIDFSVQFPTAIASPTRYVGVFLGEPTSVGPEGEISIPPTIPPVAGQFDGSAGAAVGSIPVAPQGQPIDGNCPIAIAQAFANAYAANPTLQNFGCPRDAGTSTALVTQRFERGRMFWRDTRQIIIVSDDRNFWRVPDTWQEGQPADDPSLSPPEGASQPVRGFGLAWRSNDTFRNTLGWARGPEVPIASFWQDFDGGSLFLGDNSQIYAIPAGDTGQYVGGIAQ